MPSTFIDIVLFPATEDHLGVSITFLMTVHLVLAYGIQIIHLRGLPDAALILPKILDAGTFATSVLLLSGLFVPKVLAVLGSMKPFLIVAAFAGINHSLHALAPPSGDRPRSSVK